ncbi:hypothetical protein ACHAWF_011427 [Thalassiosira exigua]
MPGADEDRIRPKCALGDDAGVLSRLSFAWAYPLLESGSRRPLEDVDLPELPALETSAFNAAKIEALWDEEKRTGRNDLGKALLVEYLRSTWAAQLLAFANLTARIGQAWALGMLMEQFGKFDEDGGADESSTVDAKKMGYLYAGSLVFCGLVAFPTKQQQFFRTHRKGTQLRIGMVAAIYRKTLRLPATGAGNGTSIDAGHVTNLASNDVERFVTASVSAVFLLVGPIVTVVILCVGLLLVGPAFAAGFCLLALLVPLQSLAGRRFARYRSKIAAVTDARVGLVSQCAGGARIVKYNCWEGNFEEKISRIRTREIDLLYKASSYKALNEALYYFASLVVSVFIFLVHVASGGELSPKIVFSAMTLNTILQYMLTKNFPNAVMGLSECSISCKRIQALLEQEDQPQARPCLPDKSDVATEQRSKEPGGKNQEILALSHVTCHWKGSMRNASDSSSAELQTVALSDVSLSFEAGKLYCIVGAVASGKSALLHALAGELPVSKGNVARKYSSLSYAVQVPWIMDASIRENIVMGLPFDEKKYHEVVNACGLAADISSFILGDMTILGDRGIQCSGGQRARVGLARTLYCDSDIVLLDDCLSAVDNKVAQIIFSAMKQLSLKRGRCVVLVTHQLQYASEADCCILIDGGKILGRGSFSHCVSISDGEIASSLQATAPSTERDDLGGNDDDSLPILNGIPAEEEDEKKAAECDAQKEKRATGIISLITWKAYGKATGGSFVCFVLLVMFVATQVSQLVAIVEIGDWSGANREEQTSYIAIMLWLTFAVIALSLLRAYFTFHVLIKASQRLHNQMLESVLRSKIVFFDTNPIGRILNRFSADTGVCDETLPLTVYDFSVGIFVVSGSVVTAVISLPFTLVALPPLLYFFIKLRRVFVKTTRELKRMEGVSRSPIYAMLSEALKGISTIRCNDKTPYLLTKFEEVQNSHSRAYFCFVASSRWFAFQLDIISFSLMSVASIFAVVLNDQGWWKVKPSILGLALTLLIQVSTTNFPWIIRQSAEVANQMISVERIDEFSSLPSEAPLQLASDSSIDEDWPRSASIKVNNITARYRPNLPPCLNGLHFEIGAGQRVGIVGRTGSGKSSLAQALFRILEVESGFIEIDGLDVKTIGLRKLRSSMSIISQSPVLFSGCTVRQNLDPFSNHSDEEIRDAIQSVQMMNAIDDLPENLNAAVADGGENFSVGQRQLLCLARAILDKNKILVLDEPTANVDIKTDELLQKTIREKFSDATILSIAHRLDTIIDYDVILVLGEGKVLEFGSPANLLAEDGHFSSMVKCTGDAMSKSLRQRAKQTTT